MGPRTGRQRSYWSELKRTGNYRGSRADLPKFWMVVSKVELKQERFRDWMRNYPGATGKEAAYYFGVTHNTALRWMKEIRDEWRRELALRKRPISRRMKR